MATHSHRHPAPVETESGVFAKVAALLLGILVAVLGFFALLMWADARESRDATTPASTTPADDHNVALPLSSFAGVVPENAAELAAAHKPYDATLPPLTAGDLVKVQMTLKDITSRSRQASNTTRGPSAATAPPDRSCTFVRARPSR